MSRLTENAKFTHSIQNLRYQLNLLSNESNQLNERIVEELKNNQELSEQIESLQTQENVLETEHNVSSQVKKLLTDTEQNLDKDLTDDIVPIIFKNDCFKQYRYNLREISHSTEEEQFASYTFEDQKLKVTKIELTGPIDEDSPSSNSLKVNITLDDEHPFKAKNYEGIELSTTTLSFNIQNKALQSIHFDASTGGKETVSMLPLFDDNFNEPTRIYQYTKTDQTISFNLGTIAPTTYLHFPAKPKVDSPIKPYYFESDGEFVYLGYIQPS